MACSNPFVRKDKEVNSGPVPCGSCADCRARRASGWSFRLIEEEKISNSADFITLTYDTKFVPITRSGFMDLSKRDVQLFFKRLRKLHSNDFNANGRSNGDPNKGRSIKYYAVGEYGGKTWRPHYHIILFNASVELIQEAWSRGSVYYGKVSGASVGYTLKYISKAKRVPVHKNDDRQPEFSLMSKHLGESYVKKKVLTGIMPTLITECI